MDIFIIKTSGSCGIQAKLLEEFKKKEISNEKKFKEHCFSYFMLDRIFREVYKIENREIEFVNNKPYLKSRDKFFGISHSHEFVALGFSDFDCGIDIEKMKDRNFVKISKKMKFNADSLEDFYKSWTKYEANYKLGQKSLKEKSFQYKDYIITASSANKDEEFEIYVQNGTTFSNLKSGLI